MSRDVGTPPDLLYRTIPETTRATLAGMGAKLGVTGETLACAVLAWDALVRLSPPEQRKALAVLMGLASRAAKQ